MRSTVATAVVFGIASFLPLKTFSLVWPLVYSFLVAGYASKVFGIPQQRPTRSGSWSLALGAGIVGAAALISALLLLAWILRR
jgi:hypothetical protein